MPASAPPSRGPAPSAAPLSVDDASWAAPSSAEDASWPAPASVDPPSSAGTTRPASRAPESAVTAPSGASDKASPDDDASPDVGPASSVDGAEDEVEHDVSAKARPYTANGRRRTDCAMRRS